MRCLAIVVPRGERSRWCEEWLAELEQVAGRLGPAAAMRMGVGAVADAWALRRISGSRGGAHQVSNDQRGFMRIGFTWLDLKLAVRMLARYPGLSAVGVIGMAVGIAIAAGAFSILSAFMTTTLPFEEGDRIVAIQNVDTARNSQRRPWVHDFEGWREELTGVVDLGAFRQVARNLILPGVTPEAVQVAEISASAFRVTRTNALLGRPLANADEHPSAPPVLVIGYDVWQSTFGGDPAVLGREVQLGDTYHAIVGVMPAGFAFPIRHGFWVPLRVESSRYQRGEGPELFVFGRLTDGVTYSSAQAELTASAERIAAEFPATHERIHSTVVPYTFPFFDMSSPEAVWLGRLVQVLFALLLAIVSVNVAILVYARTARRQGEIAVRTALGAARGRIVAQLFVEALVLAAVAAVVGLIGSAFGLAYINEAMEQAYGLLPFWWDFRLSPGVVFYVAALALFAAAIVGVVPALKVTGRRVATDLQRISSGGGSGMRLGGTWTALIVTQVTFAVALMPAAIYQTYDAMRLGTATPGFAADEFLVTTVTRDPGSAREDESALRARYGQSVDALAGRMAGDPAVADWTFALAWPGAEAAMVVEIEGVDGPSKPVDYNIREGSRAGHLAGMNRVAPTFFSTFDVPLLAGRLLAMTDATASSTAVLVNQAFARDMLGNRSVLGRRIRYVGRSGDAPPGTVMLDRWYEVVGIVGDFPAQLDVSGASRPKLYHAGGADTIQPATLLLRLRGVSPGDFSQRLREASASVDPNLQLRGLASLDTLLRQDQNMMRTVAAVLLGLTGAVLLLSSAGIYAMMSFTVAQRRKEIGLRAALGADPRRLLGTLFSRAIRQLAAGAVLGISVALLLEYATGGELMRGHAAVVLPVVAVLMTLLGLLATLGPARRGLRIHPTEALRDQG
jgi:putative ABC transport system permease protein